MRTSLTLLLLAAAVPLLGAGPAGAVVLCPAPTTALEWADTAVVEGVVSRVDLKPDRPVSPRGQGRSARPSVRSFEASVDLQKTLRGEVEGSYAMYEFTVPVTGCGGPAVKSGDEVVVTLAPTSNAARREVMVHSRQAYEAALARGLRVRANPSRPSEDEH